MSEADSDHSGTLHGQIPTPHFGESYSQSGYSPVMPRRQQAPPPSHGTSRASHTSSGSTRQSPPTRAEEGEGEGHYQKVGVSGKSSAVSAEQVPEDDTEFVDNDAYITFTPKFQIVGEERGKVFETVQHASNV